MRSISKLLILNHNETYYKDYYCDGETFFLCKEELEKVVGRALPPRIKVTVYDRKGKDRIGVVIRRLSSRSLVWIDDDWNRRYLTLETRRTLQQCIPLKPGKYVIYFKVEPA